MGTSVSSSGPGPGVSFDPPWLDDIDIPGLESLPADQQQSTEQQLVETPTSPNLAPPARFRGARINLGEYVKSGSKSSLRRSLGHYSKTGMGGAKNVAHRMRASTAVGSGLFRTLQSIRDGNNKALSDLFTQLKADGANAYQFIDVLVDSVCPQRGSIDEESCRNSVCSVLSRFLDNNPDADISNLSDDTLWSLTSSFLGFEAFSRVQLDIGQSFETKQVSMAERIARLNDMHEYIEAEISAQINILRSKGENQSSNLLQRIMNVAIEKTFCVFEGEI